jgi:hypothetical protein
MVGGMTIATLPAVEVIGSRVVQFADVADADAQG